MSPSRFLTTVTYTYNTTNAIVIQTDACRPTYPPVSAEPTAARLDSEKTKTLLYKETGV
jgi:hypothetical protein